MTDTKIRIKPHAKSSLVGSLAQRALIVSLCLLVLPLFLHSLFLYKREYDSTLADVQQNLALTARAQRAIFEEGCGVEWRILDGALDAEPEMLQRLQIVDIPMPDGVPDHFVIVNLQDDVFYTGKRISPTRALAMTDPIGVVFEQLTDFEKPGFPLSLAFIDSNGETLIGAKQETVLSVQLPIEGANFSLYLSIPEGAVERLHKEWYFLNFLSLFFFIGVLGGILVWLVTKRIAKPLNQLCHAMERVGEGAVHVRYIPDKMGFEINELGKQFNQTLDQLLEHSQVAEREKLARERLAEELKIGHDIQASLLPSHFPDYEGLDIAAGFLPAREVGGDFYDLFALEDGKLMIAMADTAGKGISACLYSLGLRSMLRMAAIGKATLSEIVLQASDLFWHDAKHSGIFVTLWIGIYDTETKGLEYCSQGHPPAYLIRGKTHEALWTPGIALGAQAFNTIKVKKAELEKGDLLFLYTDGVIESHDPERKLFGANRLQEFLVSSMSFHSEKLVGNLLQEIEVFCRGAPQHDDITMLSIKVK